MALLGAVSVRPLFQGQDYTTKYACNISPSSLVILILSVSQPQCVSSSMFLLLSPGLEMSVPWRRLVRWHAGYCEVGRLLESFIVDKCFRKTGPNVSWSSLEGKDELRIYSLSPSRKQEVGDLVSCLLTLF